MTVLVRSNDGDLITPNGGYLLRTHEPNADCELYGCAIHAPSRNVQNDMGWPYNWRDDRGILERLCKHGVGHPDLDSAAFLARIDRPEENVHGCDGCCRTPNDINPDFDKETA